jgi:outer membrane protein assembly factor BamB
MLAAALAIASLTLVRAAADTTSEKYWPQWRGPYATGVSKTADPPIEWSETKNIRWKVEIPGRGSGTPVIWGEKVFVLSAVPVGVEGAAAHAPLGGSPARVPHKFVSWRRPQDRRGDLEKKRRVGSAARNHPQWGTLRLAIGDDRRPARQCCPDPSGPYARLTEAALGAGPRRQDAPGVHEGQTPSSGKIVVQWDHQGQSFIAALDKLTGKELWRTNRQEIDSWSTPLVVERDGGAQVIAAAMNKVIGYELETGKVVWESPGLTMNPIPSSVYEDGILIAMAGFRGSRLRAIRLADAKGDISATGAEIWSIDHDTPYVPSPLLYDGIVYFLKSNSGILSAYDAKTGKPHYALQRLDGVPNVFASPVGARGRVYFPGQEGTTLVIKHGPAFEVLAKNALDDGFNASPALVDGELYLRGFKNLYSIGK